MKHILITGGSDGIGKLTAQQLLQESGFKVTILGRDKEKTEKASKELGCTAVTADVSDYEALQKAIQKAEKVNGPVDVLINCAGIWTIGALVDNDPELIKRTLEINTLGTIYASQIVARSMVARASGRIINVISQAGLYAKADRSVYNASKWAITGFTKSIQEELRPSKVSVVGFYPGAMATGFFAKSGDMKDRSNALAPELAAEALVYLCKQPAQVEILEYGVQSIDY